MAEYKPIKVKLHHPSLPEEMLLFRDTEMMESFKERYPGVLPERLGRLCLAMFRGTEDHPNAPDNDYMGVGREEEDGWNWYIFFERQEEVTYLGGIALGAERQRAYHSMLRANDFKTAQEKFGWSPQIIIEDEPSDEEREAFADYLINKYSDLHEDLSHALEEDLSE